MDAPQTLTLDPPSSPRRLNAAAPEFVPRSPPPPPPPQARHFQIHRHRMPMPTPFFAPPAGAGYGVYDYGEAVEDADLGPVVEGERLSDEATHKITRQVEYYFSDINLATTELLMRFISKDPDGFVPMSVIACFKKVKTLVQSYPLLANALRTSSKLIVSEDGRKVRRVQPFTEADLEEMQMRIVVAENLPEDHSYQSLKRIFSHVGRVKTIRTCYPQTPNVASAAPSKATKLDMLFGNRLHAFIEYETFEDAERAVVELNDEKNWRNGLRVRSLHLCMTRQGPVRGRKGANDVDGIEEEDVSTSDQPTEKYMDDPSQLSETLYEHMGENFNDRDGGGRRGRGRGRGGRGRGRGGQFYNSRGTCGSVVGTMPSHVQSEHLAVTKQPPGPRMPDGTRGFAIGRGKPLNSDTTA